MFDDVAIDTSRRRRRLGGDVEYRREFRTRLRLLVAGVEYLLQFDVLDLVHEAEAAPPYDVPQYQFLICQCR
jgi:hypothetical protein